jgi:colanic acid/amylovoran biosynthesis protein
MRVLITNVYSYQNKGDAAIVLSLVQEVHRVFGDNTDILLQTTDVLHDVGKYGAPVTSSLLWILLSSVREAPLWKRGVILAKGLLGLVIFLGSYRLFERAPRGLLSHELQQFVQDNRNAECVIACGGGYLRAGPGSRETLLLGVTCLNFLTAHYLGKQVYLYSQSIGPVHGQLQTKMLRFALNRVNLIEAREDVSLQFLQDLRVRTTTVMTADPALLLGGCGTFPSSHVTLTPKRLHVGITVRKWFKNPDDFEAYIGAVAETVDYLIKTHNAEVFYVPQVIAGGFGDDDRLVARQVWERVDHKERFTVVEADLHPFEVIGLCGKMDIFIGTRMHSNIFALISGVPVVAIEYEHKTKGIMRGLGLEPLTIDIRDVTFITLKERVELLLRHRGRYQKLIAQNLPNQIDESRKAIELIQEAHAADNLS